MTKSSKIPFSVSTAGATAATRYVGGTTTGAPSTGTFVVGDWAVAQNGHLWICTAGGTPGTWVDAGSGSGGTAANVVTSANATANKLTVTTTSVPPTSPAVGDVVIWSDRSTISGTPVSGQIIDLTRRMAILDVQVNGTTMTEAEGLSLSIPPQTRPYIISFSTTAYFVTGTAAVGSTHTISCQLQEFSYSGVTRNFQTRAVGFATYTTSVATTKSIFNPVYLEYEVDPHTDTRTYSISTALTAAAVSGWTSSQLLMNVGAGPANVASGGQLTFYQPGLLKAVTL